ncbi:N-acetylneuraminate synthase family protein [Prosthecobacter sp.]|uniref:N-acetylneuraminate synthase family protein n=1 Tax=Prosthecobacter sp. TaxID=1965333 RepID=UPI001DC68AFA|nr:N-acetylneuraminate synthase family protein [Prosthecobacter sp.]MCB1275288.1 N-acetylneuraminate synthase family protein [Prosthecobacter sp.]
MQNRFDFRGLYVLDLANNHQGQLDHALRIIKEHGQAVAKHGVKAALKFQFRHFDTFIHPAHKTGSTNKHIPRFLANALSDDDFARLTEAVREAGMLTMATPFDEESIDLIEKLDISLIKIASCSARDWPLLEKAARFNRPVVVSTGGLTLSEIDDVVSFLEHRSVDFALMHCVSVYPTPPEHLQLNQVATLKHRHPRITVGFSTHEDPADTRPVMVAVAKGAEMLERHVGVVTDKIQLNAYSSTPEQTDAWIREAENARVMCGATIRPVSIPSEQESLKSLKRGVFAARDLQKGEALERDAVYFAMPMTEGQLTSDIWKPGITLQNHIAQDGAIMVDKIQFPPAPPKRQLIHAIHEVKSMLNEARIFLPVDFNLEFSHHYGVENFTETGAVLIDCINREYCKKLVIQLPGQAHPNHFHKRKEETFMILAGELELVLEGRLRVLYPGDLHLIPQGAWHSFSTKTGVIFEEVSTTHHNDDSFYEDKIINERGRDYRKTVVKQWGRYQLDS